MSAPRRPMVRKTLLATALLLALLAPTAPPAGAASERDPLLASGGAPGGGWISVAYEIPPGGEAYLSLTARDYAGPVHLMTAEYRADGSLFQAYDLWRWGPEDRAATAYVQPEGAPGALVRVESGSGVEGTFFGMGYGQRNVFQAPLVKILLLSAAGDVGTHEWRLHGTTGVRILALAEGDAARLYRTADFLDGPGVGLAAPTPPGGVVDATAFHDAGGRIDVRVEDRLYGFFGAGDGTAACTDTLLAGRACHDPKPEGTLAWSGPEGGAEGPAATTTARFRGAAPGDYSFRVEDWSSVGATQGGPCVGPLWTCAAASGSEVVLAVVDAAPAIP